MALSFVLALLLLTASLYALRGGLYSANGLQVAGFDLEGIGVGAIAVLIAVWFFGPLYALALVIAVAIHEFGHVAAYRVAGHDDARFRLVPILGGRAISDRRPETQIDAFFISLAGPALCLAPMVLAFVLSGMIAPVWHLGGEFLWVFATVTAALNFLNLLPFWPLDGGRCIRAVAAAFHPQAATGMTIAMSAAFAAAAVWIHSVLLLGFALLGAQSIVFAGAGETDASPMTDRQAAMAFAAYLFTLLAHFSGGLFLLTAYL